MTRITKLGGRESRHTSGAANVAKTIVQTVVFWSTFLVFIPSLIVWAENLLGWNEFRFSSPATTWAGAVLFIAGGTLGLTSGIVMAVVGRGTPLPLDCPTRLVIAGPYRFIRNPMVVAGLAQGVAVGTWMGSWPVIVYALCGGPVWNCLVRPWEERDLTRRLGESYTQYQRAVPCWIPRCTAYRDTTGT